MIDENSPLRRRGESTEVLPEGGATTPEASGAGAAAKSGNAADGARADDAHGDAAKAQGSRTGGSKTDGTKTDGTSTEEKDASSETPKGSRDLWLRRGARSRGRGAGGAGLSTISRQASVISSRLSRRRAGAGGSGFYRDASNIGDDHWQSVSATLPDLAPRLPSQWMSGSTRNLSSPQPAISNAGKALGDGVDVEAAEGSPGAAPSHGQRGTWGGASSGDDGAGAVGISRQASGGGGGGGGVGGGAAAGGGGGGGDGGSAGGTSVLKSLGSTRGAGMGASVRSLGGNNSSRNWFARSTSADVVPGEEVEATGGAAATAAANALLQRDSVHRRQRSTLSRSGLSARRVGLSVKWMRKASSDLPPPPPRARPEAGGSGSAGAGANLQRFASFKNVKDPARVQRLKLGEHGVRPCLPCAARASGPCPRACAPPACGVGSPGVLVTEDDGGEASGIVVSHPHQGGVSEERAVGEDRDGLALCRGGVSPFLWTWLAPSVVSGSGRWRARRRSAAAIARSPEVGNGRVRRGVERA